MKQNGIIHIRRNIIHNGIEVQVDRKIYYLNYPSHIWKEFPEVYRQTFADSVSYFFTKHLSLVDGFKLRYNFPPPVTEPFFLKGLLNSLPDTVLVEGENTTMSTLIKKLYNSQFNTEFTGRPRYARFKNVNRNSWTRAIIPFSFGKDSLLTFALTRELGIKPYPVFFREPRSPYENRHKALLARKFYNEFEIDINVFPVTTGWLRAKKTCLPFLPAKIVSKTAPLIKVLLPGMNSFWLSGWPTEEM